MTKARDTSNLVSSVTGIAVTISGDPVVLGVGNTEHVRVTGDGRLGVGTDNPLTTLHVDNSDGSGVLLLGSRNSNAKYQYINFNGTTNGDHAWQIGRSPASGVGPDNGLYVYNLLTSSTEIGITTTGDTGIGTDNPSARLDVVSDISSGYIAEFRQADASNTGQIVIDSPVDGASRPSYMDYATGGSVKWTTGLAYLDTDRSFHIGTGSGLSNSKLTIKTDGSIGIGTNNPQEDLHIGSNSPYILLDDYDNNYKWKLKGTAWFAIEDNTAGEDRLRILSDGNVGINTSSPWDKSTVNEGAIGFGTGSASATNHGILNYSAVNGTLDVNAYSTGGNTYIRFYTSDSGASSQKAQITNDGQLSVTNGDTGNNAAINIYKASGSDSDTAILRVGYDSAAAFELYRIRNGANIYAGPNQGGADFIFQTKASGGSSSEKLRVTSDGRVNLGANTTNTKLYVYDDSGLGQNIYSYHNGTGAYAGLFQCASGDSTQYAIYGYVNTSSTYSSGGVLGYSINSSIYAILGYWSTAAYYTLYGNGLVYAAGGFSSSDERLKDVSARIEGGVLDNLTSLVPVEYTWKENTEQGRGLEGVTQIGLIAQEVEVNFPHLVMENLHTRVTGINTTTLNEEIGLCKSIEYGKLTCYLLVALTEAYDKIKTLEQHVGIAST